MNRRAFLSFLSVAPVAGAMAAKALATESMIYIGVDWASEADRLGVTYMRDTLSGWEVGHARISADDLHTLSRHPDLFRLDSLMTEYPRASRASRCDSKTEPGEDSPSRESIASRLAYRSGGTSA